MKYPAKRMGNGLERRLSERLLTGASNIRTNIYLSTTCIVYEYVFEQCNAQQLLHVRRQDFNDDHSEENTDFVQLIPRFQECDEDIETWMACDAEDCGYQMLNDDEIVTSVQEESDPVDDETNEDEDNNNESSKDTSNADALFALNKAMEGYEQQSECCPTQLLLLKRIRDLVAKKRRCTMEGVQRKISGYFPQ
ncbi:uncharacterized protein TNCV_4667241 [Trichonephila clavipes]|nr:uncharacterized protein TNCV_4667241 [Trichonephila clavipes]